MRRQQGLTLVEVVVASALLALLVAAIWTFMTGSANTYARDSARQMTQDNARRILDDIAQELRDADTTTFSVANGSTDTTMKFRKSLGFDTATNSVKWSSDITYRYETGSIYVPHLKAYEGRLVRSGPDGLGATGATKDVRLCEYVKPPAPKASPPYLGGFQVSRAGDRVTITLTLRTFDEDLKEMTTTLSTSVTLRITAS